MKKLLIFLSAFCWFDSNGQNPDIDLLRNINSATPSQYWIQTTNTAYYGPMAFVAGSIIYGSMKQTEVSKQNAWGSVFSVGIGISLSTAIKLIAHRERPWVQYPNEVYPWKKVKGKSFPSGHTTMAFVSAMSLSFQYGKWYSTVPAVLWASSVGFSRLKLGEHFPTDVLGGIVVGTGAAILSRSIKIK